MGTIMRDLELDQRVVFCTRMQLGYACKIGTAEKLIVELQNKNSRGGSSRESLTVCDEAPVMVMRNALDAVTKPLDEHGCGCSDSCNAHAVATNTDINRAASVVRRNTVCRAYAADTC
jgi:hypothetical protein